MTVCSVCRHPLDEHDGMGDCHHLDGPSRYRVLSVRLNPPGSRPTRRDAMNRYNPVKCPRCDGQGHTAKPPWVPGDVNEWASNNLGSHKCPPCDGTGILWLWPDLPEETET